jgi:hypothetical protein
MNLLKGALDGGSKKKSYDDVIDPSNQTPEETENNEDSDIELDAEIDNGDTDSPTNHEMIKQAESRRLV